MIAILHAPNQPEKMLPQLKLRMNDVVEEQGLPQTEILVNPAIPLGRLHPPLGLKIALVGWGDPDKPSWDALIGIYGLSTISRILCFNLNEYLGFDEQLIVCRPDIAHEYWGRKVQRGQRVLFEEGYYVRAFVPYGLKKVAVKQTNTKKCCSRLRYLLVPGDQEQIEIVRLIFDLFVHEGHSLSSISNLLSAQRIKSPGSNAPWTWGNVKKVLENSFYIGANKLGKSIRYDVFCPILDKSIYFEAQAKLHRESESRSSGKPKRI